MPVIKGNKAATAWRITGTGVCFLGPAGPGLRCDRQKQAPRRRLRLRLRQRRKTSAQHEAAAHPMHPCRGRACSSSRAAP